MKASRDRAQNIENIEEDNCRVGKKTLPVHVLRSSLEHHACCIYVSGDIQFFFCLCSEARSCTSL